MNTYKSTRIIFWVTTIIIFLFEGVMPALTGNSELAKEGIRHLGYPDYFRVMLTVYKVIGSLVIVLPFITGRIKEWGYFGLGITMISAFISHVATDGFSGMSFFPLLIFAILVTSYLSYHKLASRRELVMAH
ncbi:MAG: DoxX family protein [Chitinophagaceae bacterium]|nr:MAG: DoxX family protein [Chitinophagaceae bacterium]